MYLYRGSTLAIVGQYTNYCVLYDQFSTRTAPEVPVNKSTELF